MGQASKQAYPVKVWQGRVHEDGNNDWRVIVTETEAVVEESDLDAMGEKSWTEVDPSQDRSAIEALRRAARCFAAYMTQKPPKGD